MTSAREMRMKLVDLTQPWGTMAPPFPTDPSPVISVVSRISRGASFSQKVETSMHCGTHIDAPIHFVSGGKDMASVPLEQLYGDGVIVDISDVCGEFDIIKPHHITDKMEVERGDILIIHTGFHHFYFNGPTPDETAYFCKHPGPTREFAEWAIERRLKWIGFDCGSADHPMNNIIQDLRPDIAREFEKKVGRKASEVFPREGWNSMHRLLFPHGIIHAENVGGDIDEVLNTRTKVGAFPWRWVGGDGSICRIVAFL
jgi:arylformamidase